MRKLLGNRMVLAVSALISISMLLIIFSFRMARTYCAGSQCHRNMQTVKEGEMFWESLSHRIINAVAY